MKYILIISLLLVTFSCQEVNESTNSGIVNNSTNKEDSISNKKDFIKPENKSLDSLIIDNEELDKSIETEETVNEKVNPEKTAGPPPIIVDTIDNIIDKTPIAEVIEIVKPNHTKWDELLKKHVTSSGKVNYNGLKSSLSIIESYIRDLESFNDQNEWSRNEKLAYWINLYNAATVRLICKNYPLSSITNLNGGKPWDVKLITIGNKSYSLNNIENDIIRKRFTEPRIHFAVNCAAKSCPKLMNSAFLPEKLSRQFAKQSSSFINGTENVISSDKIAISKIFEWYKSDFNSLIEFLNKYSDTEINTDATISYKEYNWDLND